MADDPKPNSPPSTSTSQPPLERMEKGGYQPLNEGYTPLDRRGYTPNAQASTQIPPLPTGGTAQSPKPDAGKDSK